MPVLRLVTVLCAVAVAVADTAVAAPYDLLTVGAPPVSLEDPPVPAAKGLRTVYLNFDGVTLTSSATNDDSRANISFVISLANPPGTMLTVPAFSPSDLGDDFGLGRTALINKVVADLYTPVTVSASDDVDVARVELRLDGTLVDTDTTAPYEFQLAEPGIGQHSLEATAVDTSDNSAIDTITVYAGDCVEDDECDEGFVCDEQRCVMSSEMQGALGGPCMSNNDCESGLCGTSDGESLCTQNCSQDSDCPVGFECLTGGGACWPDDGEDDGEDDPPPDDNPGDDDDDAPLSCLEGAIGARGSTSGGTAALFAVFAMLGLCRPPPTR